MSISKELVRRFDQLMQSHGANQPLGYSGSDTGGKWVGRRMGDIVERLRTITNTSIVEQKIRWLQDYNLQTRNDTEFDKIRPVRKNTKEIVKILNCQQWGNARENTYNMQFSDGFIAPGVYITLFEFVDTITVAGDIPNTVACPNECDGGNVCVDTKTGKCDFCGQYFNIVSTKIEVKV